jgi:RNA polymerase-binding transcription factor DksA
MRDFSAVTVLLHEQRAELERRVHAVEKDARRSGGALEADFAEQAVQRQNDQVLDALNNAGILELQQINAALQRLADQHYGICVSCGEEIPMPRLLQVPYTDRCIDCAELDG